jgi:hypothetical protein
MIYWRNAFKPRQQLASCCWFSLPCRVDKTRGFWIGRAWVLSWWMGSVRRITGRWMQSSGRHSLVHLATWKRFVRRTTTAAVSNERKTRKCNRKETDSTSSGKLFNSLATFLPSVLVYVESNQHVLYVRHYTVYTQTFRRHRQLSQLGILHTCAQKAREISWLIAIVSSTILTVFRDRFHLTPPPTTLLNVGVKMSV